MLLAVFGKCVLTETGQPGPRMGFVVHVDDRAWTDWARQEHRLVGRYRQSFLVV